MSLRKRVQEAVMSCPTLTNQQLYTMFDGKPKSSIRVYANEIRNHFRGDIAGDITIPTGVRKGATKNPSSTNTVGSAPDPYDTDLLAMNDIEQARHLYKQAICDKTLSMRERILAADKLVNLKDKQGKVDEHTKTELEVYEEYSKQSTSTLVGLLNRSSQKEQG